MTFSGFPTGTLTFMKGLAKHNNKSWFDQHRAEYDEYWVETGKEFVLAAGGPLARMRPGIKAEPRINGSMFRINRDIRFSKDKTPYKQTLDMWFWEGDRKHVVSSFYFRLSPTAVYAGAGSHGFDKSQLAAYRASVARKKTASTLISALAKCANEVEGETYKRIPATQADLSDEQAALLRHSYLAVTSERAVGDWVHTAEVLEWALAQWRQQLPVHAWLIDNVTP